MQRVFWDDSLNQFVSAKESIRKETERVTVNMDTYVLRYARSQAFYGGLTGAGIAAVVALLFNAWLGLPLALALVVMVPSCALLLAGLVGLKAGSAAKREWLAELAYNYVSEQRDPVAPDEPPADGLTAAIRLDNGQVIEVLQPAPGELAAWMRQVLDESSGVKFTQNTARGRGWNIATYKSAYHSLREAGLFMQGPNQVPLPTTTGRRVLKAWLNHPPTLSHYAPDEVVNPQITTTFTTENGGAR
jgi:hypothetical protein